MTSFFNQLSGKDILAGIKSLNLNPASKKDDSRHYYIWYEQQLYPIKETVRRAMEIRFHQKESFGSGQAQELLINLGFPIIHNEFDHADSNFSEIELKSFERLTKRGRYDSDDPIDSNIGLFLSELPWLKTKRWAERLKKKGWQIKGRRAWNVTHKTLKQKYKLYTWWKIYPEGYTNPDIYFTVGIHTDGNITYKMDIQHNADFFTMVPDRKHLFYAQRDAFEESWPTVRKEGIEKLSMSELVERSDEYFHKMKETYFRITEELKSIRPKRAARICWNTFDWRKPSGQEGKAKESFEGINGFGHDEWLFDFDDNESNNCYARLENVAKSSKALIGKKIDLLLYTRNQERGEFEWIGEIRNVQVISKAESEKFHSSPDGQDIFNKRISELKELDREKVNVEEYILTQSNDMYNIKFDPIKVVLFDRPIPESQVSVYKIKLNRYKLLSIDQGQFDEIIELQYQTNFEPRKKPKESGEVKYTELIKKQGSAYSKEYENRHGRIQHHLVNYLRTQFPSYTIVHEESYAGMDRRRVDVVVELPHGVKYFIEVKSYPFIGSSIRVAVGQLLEYNHFPDTERAEKLIIVSDKMADPYYERYLKNLRDKCGIQIYYLQFDLKKKQLVGGDGVI